MDSNKCLDGYWEEYENAKIVLENNESLKELKSREVLDELLKNIEIIQIRETNDIFMFTFFFNGSEIGEMKASLFPDSSNINSANYAGVINCPMHNILALNFIANCDMYFLKPFHDIKDINDYKIINEYSSDFSTKCKLNGINIVSNEPNDKNLIEFTKTKFYLSTKVIKHDDLIDFGIEKAKENSAAELCEKIKLMNNLFNNDLENKNIKNVENVKNIKAPENVIILNQKKFQTCPAIERDTEIQNLIISLASDLKNTILIGESGVGKTAIVDELAYRIQNNNVPQFLKNRIIAEISPLELVGGTQYRGDFEKKIEDIIKFCVENKAIMLINEIHTIYGAGTSESQKSGMEEMIKYAIDRKNLKVIGTTTTYEYNEFISNDSLKRRFNKIVIKEPSEDVMYKIIVKVLNDYSNRNNISIEEILYKYNKIIELLIKLTKNKHRVQADKVNNPDLSISIIDMAFSYAKAFDYKELKLEHIIKSIEINDRLYDMAKNNIIEEIENLTEKINSENKIKLYTK